MTDTDLEKLKSEYDRLREESGKIQGLHSMANNRDRQIELIEAMKRLGFDPLATTTKP